MATAEEHAADIREVAQALRSARRVTAVCHENPDADTVGAAIAVSIIANLVGAESEVISADGIPPSFAFLPRVEQVRRRPSLEPDLAVVCDAATLERVGRVAREEHEWFARVRLLNIDHHASNSCFGDLNLVDPRAAATCEVLARVVDELAIDLNSELATALLTGIVRDSHGFSDPSTSAETLRCAARLVDAGAPLAQIHRFALGELPYPTMALWGKMLANIDQSADGQIVYTILTQQMLDETGTHQYDADGLVEFLARAKGAAVVLLLRELGPAETRVSIRTTAGVDATAIAARFGGGGHARRAGCTTHLSLPATLEQILAASSHLS